MIMSNRVFYRAEILLETSFWKLYGAGFFPFTHKLQHRYHWTCSLPEETEEIVLLISAHLTECVMNINIIAFLQACVALLAFVKITSLVGWFLCLTQEACSFSASSAHSSRRFKINARSKWSRNSILRAYDIEVDRDLVLNKMKSAAATEDNPFSTLAFYVAQCLLASDTKRANAFDGASTGWTSWIDQQSEFILRSCLDNICLASRSSGDKLSSGHWIRWMKCVPAPLLIDLSSTFRKQIATCLSTNELNLNTSLHECITESSKIDAFLCRIACRIIVLPSGCELKYPFHTPTGGVTYGKLLFGGVKRYRLIGNPSSGKVLRRAGERTAIMMDFPEDERYISPCWSQYGGPARTYQAVDMGSCAFLELIMLPEGLRIPLSGNQPDAYDDVGMNNVEDSMLTLTTTQLGFDPSRILNFVKNKKAPEDGVTEEEDCSTVIDNNKTKRLYGQPYAFTPQDEIKKVVGGLRNQIDIITRRVLVSKEESNMLQLMGLSLRPRGILLYGSPGTGKTSLAKEISRHLNARSMKAIAAPELLDKWVGGSEKLVRDLFKEAEDDSENMATSTSSSLHVIIIDEIDAVFRRRSVSQDSGEITRNSVVNQLLTKIDGVVELPNILVIGITNRKELIDEALLRPGRLEVQMHIPLPDAEGRREILQIHFDALSKSGRLSQPLRLSINGQSEVFRSGLRRYLKLSLLRKLKGILSRNCRYELPSLSDLAADHVTGGFSGADIAGLVRCAGSIALARSRRDGSGVDGVLITLQDVELALHEMKIQKNTLR